MNKKKKIPLWNNLLKSLLLFVIFLYCWFFVNVLIHELGHACVAWICRSKVTKIRVGSGWNLLNFNCGGTNWTFNIFPFSGIVWCSSNTYNKWTEILTKVAGPLFNFVFLYLSHLLLKNKKKWRNNIIGYFCYEYAIEITFFWAVFWCFATPDSDGWKIINLLLN